MQIQPKAEERIEQKRVEINEIAKRERMENISETKSQFFEKNKIDKTLVDKKNEGKHVANITDTRGDITIYHTDIKKTIWRDYEQLSANEFHNVSKLDKFFFS